MLFSDLFSEFLCNFKWRRRSFHPNHICIFKIFISSFCTKLYTSFYSVKSFWWTKFFPVTQKFKTIFLCKKHTLISRMIIAIIQPSLNQLFTLTIFTINFLYLSYTLFRNCSLLTIFTFSLYKRMIQRIYIII
jgi:hypothetical protein